MTLPELMVGLAVGLFVAAISISTFVSTRTLNVVNSSSTRMTENARLATETLHTDLRSAGFAGCRTLQQRQEPQANQSLKVMLVGGTDAGFIAEGSSGVLGYSGTGTAHSPALPTALAAVTPAPLQNSDIVSVRVPADTVTWGVVATMAAPDAAPQLAPATPGNTIQRGDAVLISNCKAAKVFQVTASDPATTGVLEHATGTLTPGNLAWATDPQEPKFNTDSNVYRVQTRHYYVAPSIQPSRLGTNSLWRLTVPAPGGGALVPEEVAAGIDQLRISYGAKTDTSNPEMNVNQYFNAAALTSAATLGTSVAERWDKVLSARVQLIAATAQDNMAQGAQTYQFAGSSVTASDRRLRSVFTEVVTLRNGAP
ncbi:MAG: PilW family protein [Burkholderiaceae bacterium]